MAEVSLLEVLGRLVPSLLLIIGGLLLVRHLLQRQRGADVPVIRVVARTALSRTATVAVVEVGAQQFLVGATEQSVQLLSELDAAGARLGIAPSLASTGTDAAPATLDTAQVADLLRFPSTARTATEGHTTEQRPRIGLVERLQLMTLRRPQGPGPWSARVGRR